MPALDLCAASIGIARQRRMNTAAAMNASALARFKRRANLT